MLQVVLVAHGHLAREMKNSAQMLFGELTNLHAIDFDVSEGLDSLTAKIYDKIKALNNPVLLFADLFGGTPYNASCAVLLQHPDLEAEVVSGLSLPLVLEVMATADQGLEVVSVSLPELAKQVVRVFNRSNQDQTEEEDL